MWWRFCASLWPILDLWPVTFVLYSTVLLQAVSPVSFRQFFLVATLVEQPSFRVNSPKLTPPPFKKNPTNWVSKWTLIWYRNMGWIGTRGWIGTVCGKVLCGFIFLKLIILNLLISHTYMYLIHASSIQTWSTWYKTMNDYSCMSENKVSQKWCEIGMSKT